MYLGCDNCINPQQDQSSTHHVCRAPPSHSYTLTASRMLCYVLTSCAVHGLPLLCCPCPALPCPPTPNHPPTHTHTPYSFVEVRDTSLVWNYKHADVEFGRLQARDLLQVRQGGGRGRGARCSSCSNCTAHVRTGRLACWLRAGGVCQHKGLHSSTCADRPACWLAVACWGVFCVYGEGCGAIGDPQPSTDLQNLQSNTPDAHSAASLLSAHQVCVRLNMT